MTTAFDRHERRQWAGRGAAYAAGFAALCAGPADALLDAAEVGAGTRVLDVGAGTGTVTRAALARGAHVVAIDPEPSMLALALPSDSATRLPSGNPARLPSNSSAQLPSGDPARLPADSATRLPSGDPARLPSDSATRLLSGGPAGAVHRIAGALPSLPLADDAVEVAVANFVVNHTGDPRAALVEMGRVVRGGGRIALTVWPAPASPALALWGEIFAAAGAVMPVLPRLGDDVNFARTEDGFGGLLRRAGLVDVRTETLSWTHRTDPDTWSGIATPGAVLAHQTPAMREQIRAAYDRATVPFRDADGQLALPATAILAAGHVPDGR